MSEVKNIASDIISACISSAKSEPMLLTQRDKKVKLHSQLNIMIVMPFGSNKSTLIDQMPPKEIFRLNDYTLPGLLGTINKDGDYMPGGIMYSAGKCLIIDEQHNLKDKSLEAILSLTEQQKYPGRMLGYNITRPVNITKQYIKMKAHDNTFKIDHCRFSCATFGIFMRKRKINDHAFLSRFMPLCFNIELDDAYDMSMGISPFQAKYEPYITCPVFEDYEKFWSAHKEAFKLLHSNNPRLYAFFTQNPGYLRRNILHFCRLFSWASRGSGSISDWEKYIPYIPVFFYNWITNTLTLSEFEVLSQLKLGLTINEIAQQQNHSYEAVRKIVEKLRGAGLVVNTT